MMTNDICPKCASTNICLERVLHHFLCAYVGPTSDFVSQQSEFICPKCNLHLSDIANDWEAIGLSISCRSCGYQSIASDEVIASH